MINAKFLNINEKDEILFIKCQSLYNKVSKNLNYKYIQTIEKGLLVH